MDNFVFDVHQREQGATNVDLQLAGDRRWCRASIVSGRRLQTFLPHVVLDRLCPIIARNFARAGLVEDTSRAKGRFGTGRVFLT